MQRCVIFIMASSVASYELLTCYIYWHMIAHYTRQYLCTVDFQLGVYQCTRYSVCCAEQQCTVLKDDYFNKNLELPADDIALPTDIDLVAGAPWCTGNKNATTDHVVIVAGEQKQSCYFRCRLGFYHPQVGEAVAYSCRANDNRNLGLGVSETLKQCDGTACHNRHLHLGRI